MFLYFLLLLLSVMIWVHNEIKDRLRITDYQEIFLTKEETTYFNYLGLLFFASLMCIWLYLYLV